uniref:Uncharacterized protein n=1 Tax=Kalanchoe fedtschenkoi TaxID=63787 RepID=A0A7N0TQ70_KALFE
MEGWHSYFCYVNGKLEIIIYKIHVLLIFQWNKRYSKRRLC